MYRLLFILLFFSASEFVIAYEFRSETLKEDALSPITTKAWYALALGGLATSIIILDKHNLDDQTKNKAEFDPPFRKYGYIGEVIGWGYLNGLYVLGHGLHGHFSGRNKSLERAEIMMSSSFYTLLSTTALKVAINRSRPGFPDKRDSFPSGHASMAFNFATVVLAEHGLYYGVPAYVLAGAISYSRVNDSWHWLSDIVAGASIGISYGLGVYLNRREKKTPFIFSFSPDLKNEGGFLKISYQF